VRRLPVHSSVLKHCLCVFFFFRLVCLCFPDPTQYILHTPMARCNLFMLKVLLNTDKKQTKPQITALTYTKRATDTGQYEQRQRRAMIHCGYVDRYVTGQWQLCCWWWSYVTKPQIVCLANTTNRPPAIQVKSSENIRTGGCSLPGRYANWTEIETVGPWHTAVNRYRGLRRTITPPNLSLTSYNAITAFRP